MEHLGKTRETGDRDAAEMITVLHDDVAEEVVRSRQVIDGLRLWHRLSVRPEPLDLVLGVTAKPDNNERLESDAHDLRLDLGMEASEDSLIPQPLDALGTRRRSDPRSGSDLLVRLPRIVRQNLHQSTICSVKYPP